MTKRAFIIIVWIVAVSLLTCIITFNSKTATAIGNDMLNEEDDLYNEDITDEQEEYGFIITSVKHFYEERLTQYTMYDPETKAMYVYIDGYNSAGMSVIYNADGTPKLYSHQ